MIRDTINGGVEFAEGQLSHILEILTGAGSKLSPEQQLERGYASISSAASSLFYQASYTAEHLAESASSYASEASVSAR
jgi:hypothetical protein